MDVILEASLLLLPPPKRYTDEVAGPTQFHVQPTAHTTSSAKKCHGRTVVLPCALLLALLIIAELPFLRIMMIDGLYTVFPVLPDAAGYSVLVRTGPRGSGPEEGSIDWKYCIQTIAWLRHARNPEPASNRLDSAHGQSVSSTTTSKRVKRFALRDTHDVRRTQNAWLRGARATPSNRTFSFIVRSL